MRFSLFCHVGNEPTHSTTNTTPNSAVDEEEEDVHFDDHHILVLDLEATSTEALDKLDAAEIQVCRPHYMDKKCVCVFVAWR